MRSIVALVGLLALLAAVARALPTRASAAVQLDHSVWAPSTGPDGGGLTVVVDPARPTTLYAGGWGNVFKSVDGGGHWADVTDEQWNRVGALAVDPTHDQVVYAGTNRGVAKTVDGGRSWRTMNTGLYDEVTRGRYGEGVASLVIDAHHPQTVFAIKQGALFRTTDGGAHWHILGPAPYRTLRCPGCAVLLYGYDVTAAIDPSNARTVYASFNRGASLNLFKSVDQGSSWQRLQPQGLPGVSWLGSLTVDGSGLLYAVAYPPSGRGGVVTSSDGGLTWRPAGQSGMTVWNLQLDGGVLYASTEYGGLFRTSNGGGSWQQVGQGTNRPWGSIASNPSDTLTIYGIGDDGVVKSSDGGETWTLADKGLVSTLIPSLAISTANPKVIYAGGYGGVYKSADSGRTWQFHRGLGGQAVDHLVVAQQNPRTLYAAESWRGGLYTSGDGGANWQLIRTPFPSNGVQALAVDPHDSQTVYVSDCGGACSRGIIESTNDGGASWRPISGVPWTVQSLAIDPRHAGTLFAGTNRGDIFRSTDNGRSWQHVASPPTLPQSHQYAVVGITIDPTSSATIYAARRSGGIIKSSDGGTSWSRASKGLTDLHVNALAVDRRDPRVLYVSTGAKVFRSVDGALTWKPLTAGLPAVGVTALAIDSTSRVFAATEGDGVVQLRQPS